MTGQGDLANKFHKLWPRSASSSLFHEKPRAEQKFRVKDNEKFHG